MAENKKGRADCNQATLNTAKCTLDSTGLASRFIGLVTTLALWGWLPIGLAEWLVHREEQDDE